MKPITFDVFTEAQKRPNLDERPSAEKLWTDPYIAQQMLKAHLDPDHEAASYKHALIDSAVEWMHDRFDLSSQSRYLDLGCGPGLYTHRMASRGVSVVGVDFSENSITYARDQAAKSGMNIDYLHGNYLDLDINDKFDLASIIWCDFNVLSSDERTTFLDNVCSVMKDDGHFIFDFSTDLLFRDMEEHSSWSFAEKGGFYCDAPYLLLDNRFKYESELAMCERYTVIREGIEPDEFLLWHHFYRLDDMVEILAQAGLRVAGVYDQIDGRMFTGRSKTVALVAKKFD